MLAIVLTYNMALRHNEHVDHKTKDWSSAAAGLSPFWSNPQRKPNVEWRKWNNLFAVAMTSTHPIRLSNSRAANSSNPFEKVFGRKPNTIKNLLTEKPQTCLEDDETLKLSSDKLPKDDNSTVFLRDRTKNTKLETQCRKRKAR